MCGVEKARRDYITAEALQGYLAIRITQHREKGDGRAAWQEMQCMLGGGMGVRGIMVQDLFAAQDVTVNTPTTMKGRTQLPSETVVKAWICPVQSP